MPRKYHNNPAVRGSIRFDSQKEAARYDELIILLKTGKIRSLKLQPEYTLQEAFTTPDGTRVQAIKYRADFSYDILRHNRYEDYDGVEWIDEWEPVIEEVKYRATKTQVYQMKRKMMMEKGYQITEV